VRCAVCGVGVGVGVGVGETDRQTDRQTWLRVFVLMVLRSSSTTFPLAGVVLHVLLISDSIQDEF
jgi:hypothetical protein